MPRTAVDVEAVGRNDLRELETLAAFSSRPHPDFQSELAKEHCLAWVARRGETRRAVAFLLVWAVADELQIVDIATAPDARRRGAASALLTALRDFAVSHGFRCALLEVRASNSAALALYAAHGFETTRHRPKYYADGEDALELVRSFAESSR